MRENRKETPVEKRDRMMAGAVEMMADLKKNDPSMGTASLPEVLFGASFMSGEGSPVREIELVTEDTNLPITVKITRGEPKNNSLT